VVFSSSNCMRTIIRWFFILQARAFMPKLDESIVQLQQRSLANAATAAATSESMEQQHRQASAQAQASGSEGQDTRWGVWCIQVLVIWMNWLVYEFMCVLLISADTGRQAQTCTQAQASGRQGLGFRVHGQDTRSRYQVEIAGGVYYVLECWTYGLTGWCKSRYQVNIPGSR